MLVNRVGVIHKREVSVDSHRVQVLDSLEGSELKHHATRSFVLAPSVSVTCLTGKSVVLSSGDISVLLESNAGISLREGFYSARYGSVERTIIVDTPFISGGLNIASIRRYQNGN